MEHKEVKPVVLSPEMEDIVGDLGKSIREQFFAHRERELTELLKEYNLTPKDIHKAGYVLTVERTELGEAAVLSKVETRKKITSIEEYVSQIVDNSTMKEM